MPQRWLIIRNGHLTTAWNWVSRIWAWDTDGDYYSDGSGYAYGSLAAAKRRQKWLRAHYPNIDIDIMTQNEHQRRRENADVHRNH